MKNDPCPNCGYCPHCGRSNNPYRSYPYGTGPYGTYPWPAPFVWTAPLGPQTQTITAGDTMPSTTATYRVSSNDPSLCYTAGIN